MKSLAALNIEINKDLSQYSGIKLGGKAAFFLTLESEIDLKRVRDFCIEKNCQPVVIGDGTNSFYGMGKLNILAIKNYLRGRHLISDDDNEVVLEVSSGENWDSLVEYCVQSGYSGIEALTAIPGSVGAAPVQNIGAYSQEISKVISKVKTYDLKEGSFKEFDNSECDFSYRNSIFKENPSRYFITAVVFKLTKIDKPGIPDYTVVKDYFANLDMANPSLAEIRAAIADIRWSKLPKPEILPNCGSWFKNPIISLENYHQAIKFNKEISACPSWQMDNDMVKLSAGWLIEHTVGKDYDNGYFSTYGKNALVLVNHSLSPSTKKFLKFETDIIHQVKNNFDLNLEREPVLVI